jgi:hypothetical protein
MGFPLNLTHLTLKAALHEHEFFGICFFLRSSPCLETLTIQIGPGRLFAVSIIISNDFSKKHILLPWYDFSLFCLLYRITRPHFRWCLITSGSSSSPHSTPSPSSASTLWLWWRLKASGEQGMNFPFCATWSALAMSWNTYTLLFQRKVKKMVEMSKHTMRELKCCRRSKKPHQICRYLSIKTEDPPCFCCSYWLLDFNKWSSPC